MRILLISLATMPLVAQYDKVAALGSDSSLTPMGGPASSPPLSTEPYNLPDFRPTGKLNDHLPKWLQFGLDERFRFESEGGEPYPLNRLRIGMIIQPAPWIKAAAQVQDARSFLQDSPTGPPNNVRWDLKLAYVQFGDIERHRVTLTVGRQLIDYNSTLIANSEWRNQARSYDAAVANFRLNRFRAALFAASVVNPLPSGISHHQEGNNIYGAYGWITRVLPRSSIEPFLLWRVAPAAPVEASAAHTGRLNEKAAGFRVRGAGLGGFDYRYELVSERGSAGLNPLRAWATTAGLGYTAGALAWRPRFFAGYDYASGDRHPNDGIRGAFDTMYPTAHDRFGIADQFGWQNILAGRAGVTVLPYRRWSVSGQMLDFWLATASDSVYNSSGGSVLRDPTGQSGRHLGRELDFYTWYEINREVHIGTGIGHIFPGEFLRRRGRSAAYTYPYFVVEMFDGKRVR